MRASFDTAGPATARARWRAWRRALRTQLGALHLAAREPAVPRLAKWLIVAALAYALCPIDLIPDVIPVLGYLDDLVLVPLCIGLAIRLVPPAVWADCRARAALDTRKLAASRGAAAVIVALWTVTAACVAYSIWKGAIG